MIRPAPPQRTIERAGARLNSWSLPWLSELGLPALLFGIGVAWPGGLGPSRVGAPLAVLLVACQSLPLAARRTAPRAVFVLVGAAAAGYGVAGFAGSPIDIGELVALYTVATACGLLEALGAVAAIVAGLAAVGATNPHWPGAQETVAVTLVFAIVFAVGRNQRLRVARLVEAARHAEELERRQGERVALAAAEERLRLADELHDAVGHGLAVVLLQASVARREMGAHPERARAAVAVIEERARAAMTEMQVLLGVVHAGAAPHSPAPRIADLDDLVQPVRAAGIEVTVHRQGRQRTLPEVIEVSAYRIVQEALTNVVRHSGADRADVCLRYCEDVLEIDVSDNGRGPTDPTTSGGGRGLVGMRERATRLGGRFRVDAGPGRGVTVQAQLPFPDQAPGREQAATS